MHFSYALEIRGRRIAPRNMCPMQLIHAPRSHPNRAKTRYLLELCVPTPLRQLHEPHTAPPVCNSGWDFAVDPGVFGRLARWPQVSVALVSLACFSFEL